jgi:hypothetical protein
MVYIYQSSYPWGAGTNDTTIMEVITWGAQGLPAKQIVRHVCIWFESRHLR